MAQHKGEFAPEEEAVERGRIRIKVKEAEARERECEKGEIKIDGELKKKLEAVLVDVEAAMRIYDVVRARLASRAAAQPAGAAAAAVPAATVVISPEAAQRARIALANFVPSRALAAARRDPSYLSRGDDLKAAQRALIERRLTVFTTSTTPHSISVKLTPEEQALLENPSRTAGGVSGGTIDLGKLVDLIEQRRRGHELYASPAGAFQACEAEAEAQQRIDRITGRK